MELKFRRLAISCLDFNSNKISVHTSQYIWDTYLGVSVRKELNVPPTSVLQISLNFILETFLFSDSNTSNPLWVLFCHQSTSGRLAKLNSTTHAREINVNGPGIQLSLSSESIPRTQVIVANMVVNFNKKFLTTLPPQTTYLCNPFSSPRSYIFSLLRNLGKLNNNTNRWTSVRFCGFSSYSAQTTHY